MRGWPYPGGKYRLANKPLKEMLPYRGNRTRIEPFVGAGNMICRVENPRIGYDINKHMVAFLSAARDGWLPDPSIEITKDMYADIRMNPSKYPDCLIGYVSTGLSFSGKPWGAWSGDVKARGLPGIRKERRVYLLEQKRKFLNGAEFHHSHYRDIVIPDNSLIYCDPPYKGTYKYRVDNNFSHDEFWTWCDKQVDNGHIVFVSERVAPGNWEPVIELKASVSIRQQSNRGTRIEYLFRSKEEKNDEENDEEIDTSDYLRGFGCGL
jgi:DNA adenine methylase